MVFGVIERAGGCRPSLSLLRDRRIACESQTYQSPLVRLRLRMAPAVTGMEFTFIVASDSLRVPRAAIARLEKGILRRIWALFGSRLAAGAVTGWNEAFDGLNGVALIRATLTANVFQDLEAARHKARIDEVGDEVR